MAKLLITFGTRPELIKVAPIVREFSRRGLRDRLIVLRTGQHRDLSMIDQGAAGIRVDHSLHLDREGGSLSDLLGKLLLGFKEGFRELKDDIKGIIAQGDTASTYASALHAFHEKIPFFHVEAGMRTYDNGNPFPEEFYRRSISLIAHRHFAPTLVERDHLLREGIDSGSILVTGNTVIDNLCTALGQAKRKPRKKVLITLHRRELSTEMKQRYVRYFGELIRRNPDYEFVWLRHPGTLIDERAFDSLHNIDFRPPIPFGELLKLYLEVSLILTDSGGIQEEAGYLGIPCIVARKRTERSQGMSNQIAHFIDLACTKVPELIARFDPSQLIFRNPLYGSGNSAGMIVDEVWKECMHSENSCEKSLEKRPAG